MGDAGLIVPTKDAQALAAAIGMLLRDPQQRELLGQRGQQRIQQSFCWDVCAGQMIDYYRKVIKDANR